MHNRILFLDIDGVTWGFNDDVWTEDHLTPFVKKYQGSMFNRQLVESLRIDDSPHVPYVREFNPNRVGLLTEIINALDVKVVLSSTWRKFFSIPTMELILKTVDTRWKFGTIIDRTVELKSSSIYGGGSYIPRHEEIALWLKDNPTKSYVVLDDDMSASPSPCDDPHFVNTDGARGLIYPDAQAILRAFGVDRAGRISVP